MNEEAYASSMARENRYKQLTTKNNATELKDMLTVLGNKEDDPWPLFSDKSLARVSTINLGEFISTFFQLVFDTFALTYCYDREKSSTMDELKFLCELILLYYNYLYFFYELKFKKKHISTIF